MSGGGQMNSLAPAATAPTGGGNTGDTGGFMGTTGGSTSQPLTLSNQSQSPFSPPTNAPMGGGASMLGAQSPFSMPANSGNTGGYGGGNFIPDAPLSEGMMGTLGGSGYNPMTGRVDLGTAGGSGQYVSGPSSGTAGPMGTGATYSAQPTQAAQQAGVAINPANLVNQAYGNIGKTGIGTGANQIDQEGYNYWTNALKSGAMTPESFQRTFQESAVKNNPGLSAANLVNSAYGNIGKSGIGTGTNQIDQQGYDFWTNALQTGAMTPQSFQQTFQDAAIKNSPALANRYQDQALAQTSGARPSTYDYSKPILDKDGKATGAYQSAQQFYQPVYQSQYSNYATTPSAMNNVSQYGTTRAANPYAPPVVSPQQQAAASLVNKAYGNIGRAGIGGGANQIDQEGYDFFTNAIQSGAMTPQSFIQTFQNEATKIDPSLATRYQQPASYPPPQQYQQFQRPSYNPFMQQQYQQPSYSPFMQQQQYQQPSYNPFMQQQYQQPQQQYFQPQQQQYQQQYQQPQQQYRQPQQQYRQPQPQFVPPNVQRSSGPSQAIVNRSSQLRGTPNVMRRATGGIISLLGKK